MINRDPIATAVLSIIKIALILLYKITNLKIIYKSFLNNLFNYLLNSLIINNNKYINNNNNSNNNQDGYKIYNYSLLNNK